MTFCAFRIVVRQQLSLVDDPLRQVRRRRRRPAVRLTRVLAAHRRRRLPARRPAHLHRRQVLCCLVNQSVRDPVVDSGRQGRVCQGSLRRHGARHADGGAISLASFEISLSSLRHCSACVGLGSSASVETGRRDESARRRQDSSIASLSRSCCSNRSTCRCLRRAPSSVRSSIVVVVKSLSSTMLRSDAVSIVCLARRLLFVLLRSGLIALDDVIISNHKHTSRSFVRAARTRSAARRRRKSRPAAVRTLSSGLRSRRSRDATCRPRPAPQRRLSASGPELRRASFFLTRSCVQDVRCTSCRLVASDLMRATCRSWCAFACVDVVSLVDV